MEIINIMLIVALAGCLVGLELRTARLKDNLAEAEAKLSHKLIEVQLQADNLSDLINRQCKLMDEMTKRVNEIPVEEMINQQLQEKAYFEGLQNIFNFGTDIPKLNLDGLDK